MLPPIRVKALAAPVLLVATLLAACGEDEPTAKVGEIVPARSDDQFEDGRGTSVLTPVGELLVHAAEPVDTVSADDTRDLTALEAPEGATLVPITWQYDPWARGQYRAFVGAGGAEPVITLVTDGGEVRLPTPDQVSESESFYVVVDGDADERRLEVEFDGVTQTLDLRKGRLDAGAAKALYDVPDEQPDSRECHQPSWFDKPGVAADFECTLDGPVLLPYAAGKWAPRGSSWLVLTLTTKLRLYSVATSLIGAANYTAESVKARIRLDGRPARQEVSTGETDKCPTFGGACGFGKHLVFAVKKDRPGPLSVDLSYRLVFGSRWGSGPDPADRIKATAERTINLWRRKG